jgi:predicted AAA+ superfamily ATPase
MHGYFHRDIRTEIERALERSPAVALLGPRQCGKSTLARRLAGAGSVYLDLQNRADRNKLNEPELFLGQHRGDLVCLDEIQNIPEFFSVLRSEIDQDRRAGRFLILGSASRDLIRQSSETLAGRIAYLELTPFHVMELPEETGWDQHWNRGGFPESLLASDDAASADWRRDFIRTFLERDIPAFGPAGIPFTIMERLWRILAHLHGQTLNYSKIAGTLDVAVPTLKRYLSLLENTYMLRLLEPLEANLKKRIVKSPKVLIRDCGILHTLLDLDTLDDVMAHPVMGPSWEGHVIENLTAALPRYRASFLRTGHGAEADLVLERGGQRHLIECKASKAPKPSRGTHELLHDLAPTATWLVAPVKESYPYNESITVVSPRELAGILRG